MLLGLAAVAGGGSGGGREAGRWVSPCRSDVQNVVLASWARGGFGDPRRRLPHVLSASGNIVAILFGYPLGSPPARDHSDKILWVSRAATDPGFNLRIAARRMA